MVRHVCRECERERGERWSEERAVVLKFDSFGRVLIRKKGMFFFPRSVSARESARAGEISELAETNVYIHIDAKTRDR